MVKTSNIDMNKEEQEIIDRYIYLFLWANKNDPIKGRVRFIKEFFLFAKKHNTNLFNASEFFPYYFGPYSVRFAFRINKLKSQGYIKPIYKNMDWYYTLSKEGLEIATKISKFSDIKTIKILSKIKSDNRNLNLRNLLKDIYFDYPEFTARSLIKDSVLKIRIDPINLLKVNDGPGFVAPISPEEKEIVLKGDAARRYFNIISD